jgi:type I restriction enzyme S subunit
VRIIEKISFATGAILVRADGITKTGMILARPGDLVVSGINAAKGAIAIYSGAADESLAATIHYGAYIPNPEKVDVKFLWWMLRSRLFKELLLEYVPGGIKTELKAKRLLSVPVPLPLPTEQRRVVARIEELTAQVYEARTLRQEINAGLDAMLAAVHCKITANAPRRPLSDVAPLNRRPVTVDGEKIYPGVAVRSFGRGTFHKPPLVGSDVTWEKPYLVRAGDILVSNIKAWEGALAVAKPEDDGRVGSHRYLTCVPIEGVATPRFVCFYLLTPEGLHEVSEASPGSADRNRTLGAKAFMRIPIPVPKYNEQQRFETLCAKVDALKRLQAETATEIDALLPSILDKAFKGEL